MKITPEQIAAAFSENFSLGDVVSVEPLKKGVANKLFKVTTNSGDYVFKIAVRNTENNRVLHEVELLNTLHDLPTPKPIPTQSDNYLFTFGDYSAFVYPYLPGEQPDKLTDSMLKQSGKALAKINTQTQRFSSSVSDKRIRLWDIPGYYSLQTLNDSIQKMQNKKISDAAVYAIKNIEKYMIDLSVLPVGGLHMDYKPENTLYEGETLTGIVDFDNSYIGPFLLDVSFALSWFAADNNTFNIGKAKQFINAYQAVRPMTKEEKEGLFAYIHFMYLAIFLVCVHWMLDEKLPVPEAFTLQCIDDFMPVHLNLLEKENEFRKAVTLC